MGHCIGRFFCEQLNLTYISGHFFWAFCEQLKFTKFKQYFLVISIIHITATKFTYISNDFQNGNLVVFHNSYCAVLFILMLCMDSFLLSAVQCSHYDLIAYTVNQVKIQ